MYAKPAAFVFLPGIVALLIAGCGGRHGDKLLPPGTQRPKLQAEGWLNGSPPVESELAGKVLVLDFWAHWCGPCRQFAPELVAISQRFKDKGVVFLGFTGEGSDELNASQDFIQSAGIPWPNGYGADTTFDAFGVEQIPTVYVIDRAGKIAWHDGLPGSIEEAIESALASNS